MHRSLQYYSKWFCDAGVWRWADDDLLRKDAMTWTMQQRAELAQQYSRIGFVHGELWPTSRQGTAKVWLQIPTKHHSTR